LRKKPGGKKKKKKSCLAIIKEEVEDGDDLVRVIQEDQAAAGRFVVRLRERLVEFHQNPEDHGTELLVQNQVHRHTERVLQSFLKISTLLQGFVQNVQVP